MKNKVTFILREKNVKMNLLPVEFGIIYNSVFRYVLTIIMYNIIIGKNLNCNLNDININLEQIGNIIKHTQNNVEIYNNNSYCFTLLDFYNNNKQKIKSIIKQILSKYYEYKTIINNKIQKSSFNSVTKIIQCIFILSYFEITEIKLKKQQVISNYLTIVNIFNFTKKEIGFTNKIIDMF